MMKKYNTLAEFEALSDDQKIDHGAAQAALDRLNFKKLCGVLSRYGLVRRLCARLWIGEIGKITGQPIKLRLTREEITPYMQEDGVIGFCSKDLDRTERLLMLLAHETAHFILMQDKDYALLQNIDREYKAMPDREQAMHSPIEWCANIITLNILSRCLQVEKSQKRQQIIEICKTSLNKQLT